MPNVRETVVASIRQAFPAFTDEITDTLTAKQVPGWDSFSHVNLIFDIEEALGCEINVGKTFTLTDVGALIRHLEAETGAGPA